MFLRILIVACFALSVAQAQDIQYVFAENGLVVREKPSQGAIKVGLLDYGSAVEVVEHTNLSLDIKDNDKKVSGQWVKVKAIEPQEFFREGYVFNGFLTEEKIERPLKVKFDAFTVFVDELSKDIETTTEKTEDSQVFVVSLGATPEDRYLKVKHHQEYRTIEVFQRHQNRITIMDEGPHCDLNEFTHYNSSWKPLKMLTNSNNIFKTIWYSEKDYNRFGSVDMDALKAYVKTQCGDEWSKLIEDSKSINDDHIGVTVSQIHIRIVMTDIDGYKTEKIIIFDLPMGC